MLMADKPIHRRFRGRWAFVAASLLSATACFASNKNLQTDYSVTPDSTPAAIATALQQAVNDVGAGGGGTVLIPAFNIPWKIDRPIYVNYPNVTISGEGRGTTLSADGSTAFSMFNLGIAQNYSDTPITANHFPQVAGATGLPLDTSAGTRYGLRTWDGTTKASGYFSGFAMVAGGKKIAADGLDVGYNYWAGQTTVTFDLCVENNGTGVMKGQIFGIGAGVDRSSASARSINSDALTIFSLETDPSSGQNVRFKFRMIDASGNETVQQVRMLGNTSSADTLTLGQGVHRFTIQIDFSTGAVASFYSLNNSSMTLESNQLVSGTSVTSNDHFKQFEWGALRLGQVTSDPFSGTASQGNSTDGDWTYCGIHIGGDDEYSTSGSLGSVQTLVGGGSVNDAARYFSDDGHALGYLPLSSAPPTPVVMHVAAVAGQGGPGFGTTFGYWIPDRALSPLTGTLTVENMLFRQTFVNIGGAFDILVGQASRVVAMNLGADTFGSVPYAAVGSLNCNAPHCPESYKNLTLSGVDASIFATNANLHIANLDATTFQTALRFVGCEGRVDSVLLSINGEIGHRDYYVKCEAGQYGGPLTFMEITPDNEGGNTPDKGWFYFEPSYNPSGGSNQFTVSYSGGATVTQNMDMFTLADPPNGGTFPPGKLLVERTTPGAPYNSSQGYRSQVYVKSANWYGKVYDCARGVLVRQWIYKDPSILDSQCHIVTYHDDFEYAPDASSMTSPFQQYWIAGCSVFRVPNVKQNTNNTGTRYTEYRCTTSGTFGTGTPPQFTGYNPVP